MRRTGKCFGDGIRIIINPPGNNHRGVPPVGCGVSAKVSDGPEGIPGFLLSTVPAIRVLMERAAIQANLPPELTARAPAFLQ